MLDINNALVSHLDLRELVKTISLSLQQVIPHDFVGLAIYDAESGKFFARAADSELSRWPKGSSTRRRTGEWCYFPDRCPFTCLALIPRDFPRP